MTAFLSDAALTRPHRHLMLSPHYDDIPLSCGGTAARIAATGTAPEIALIFGDHPDRGAPLTDFAHTLHEQWGLTAEKVIAARRAEEATAARLIGASDTLLPFRDAIYRGARYTSNDDLFGETADDEANLPARIVDALELGNAERDLVRVYAPLGVGRHIDHQHGFRAGARLAAEGFEVLFYEDLPYALLSGKLDERLEELDVPVKVATLVDVASVWDTKIDAIMAYPSQLGVIFGEYVGSGYTREAIDEVMRDYSEHVGNGYPAERFWRVVE